MNSFPANLGVATTVAKQQLPVTPSRFSKIRKFKSKMSARPRLTSTRTDLLKRVVLFNFSQPYSSRGWRATEILILARPNDRVFVKKKVCFSYY
jgi:hypothetical protein